MPVPNPRPKLPPVPPATTPTLQVVQSDAEVADAAAIPRMEAIPTGPVPTGIETRTAPVLGPQPGDEPAGSGAHRAEPAELEPAEPTDPYGLGFELKHDVAAMQRFEAEAWIETCRTLGYEPEVLYVSHRTVLDQPAQPETVELEAIPPE